MKAPRTLSQEFLNIPATRGTGKPDRIVVTLSWSEDIPMEIRLTMWEPTGEGDDVAVIWSISRDVLVAAINSNAFAGMQGMGDVMAITAGPMTWLHLSTDLGHMRIGFRTDALAGYVNATQRMTAPESEAIDVDGLIHQIFNAEEAS